MLCFLFSYDGFKCCCVVFVCFGFSLNFFGELFISVSEYCVMLVCIFDVDRKYILFVGVLDILCFRTGV